MAPTNWRVGVGLSSNLDIVVRLDLNLLVHVGLCFDLLVDAGFDGRVELGVGYRTFIGIDTGDRGNMGGPGLGVDNRSDNGDVVAGLLGDLLAVVVALAVAVSMLGGLAHGHHLEVTSTFLGW